jgi:hypothetical protein
MTDEWNKWLQTALADERKKLLETVGNGIAECHGDTSQT